MKSRYILATLTILLISGIAYVAGSFQEDFSSIAAQMHDDARAMEEDLKRMESRAYFIMQRDVTRIREYNDLLMETGWVDREFELLNNSISPEQREIYIRKVAEMLDQLNSYQSMLLILHLYRHFNMSTDTYWIASEDGEGYDFSITWERWQSFIYDYGSPVEIETPMEYYGSYFSYPAIQALPYQMRPQDHETGAESFIRENAGVEFLCECFLLSQIQVLQDQIDAKLDEANANEAVANRISVTVSLATVAMLLATAMANRVNERESIDEIVTLRAEMGQDVAVERDYSTVPILIVAIALALFGLYLALF